MKWLSPALVILLLLFTLCLSAGLRLTTLPALRGDLLLGTDPARYTRLAKIISEEGELPKHDPMRYVPLGRDTRTQLTFFPHVIANFHRALRCIRPGVTMEQAAILLPVFLSSLVLLVLFALVRRLSDTYVALLAVNLTAVSPPFVARTLAGYADKDSLSLLLGLIAFYCYLCSFHGGPMLRRVAWGVVFSFSMTLLGWTWQGVGVFLAVTVITEYLLLLIDVYEPRDFAITLCRYLPLLLGLVLPKTVYRDASHPFALLAIGLPLFLLLLSLLCILTSRSKSALQVLSLRGRTPPVLVLSALISVVSLCVLGDKVLISTRNFLAPFGSSSLATSIQELQKQGILGWVFWPGAFLLVGYVGVVLIYRNIVLSLKMNPTTSLLLLELFLMGVPFSRMVSGWVPGRETTLTLTIYLGTLFLFVIGTIVIYLIARKQSEHQIVPRTHQHLFLLVWFGTMLLLSRSAVRFEFLLAVPLAVLGAHSAMKLLRHFTSSSHIWFLALLVIVLWEFYVFCTLSWKPAISGLLNGVLLLATVVTTLLILHVILKGVDRTRHPAWLSLSGTSGLVIYLVFTATSAPANWIGSHTEKSYRASVQQEPFLEPELEQALRWMNADLPRDTTIAAWWEYGSWINLLGNKRTIIDEVQLAYWLHLMAKHVFLATNEQEALEFLYTHQTDYLLITERDVAFLPVISALGSGEIVNRRQEVLRFGALNEAIRMDSGEVIYRYLMANGVRTPLREPVSIAGKHYRANEWHLRSVYLSTNGTPEDPLGIAILVELSNGRQVLRLRPQEVYFRGYRVQQDGEVWPCTLSIATPGDDPTDWEIIYLSRAVRESLMIRLFLLHESSRFFVPVYPERSQFPMTRDSVKVWEIRYPERIRVNDQYLSTRFPGSDGFRSWVVSGD